MGTLSVRTDQAMEIALAKLTGQGRTRTEAVRYALLRVSEQQPSGQPPSGQPLSERTAPGTRLTTDRHEMLAIQRFMGVAD